MKWGSRVYNQIGARWLHGWIHDVPKEHGIYESPAGAVEYGWIVFEEIGAQAVQSSWRAHENNPFRGGDLLWIHDVCAHNCGHGRFGASGDS